MLFFCLSGVRIPNVAARFSKYDFWILRIFLDRYSNKKSEKYFFQKYFFDTFPTQNFENQRAPPQSLTLIHISFQELSINFITDFNTWIKIPINLILFVTLFIVVIHHSTLGMLNIFEDYVQLEKKKKLFSILLKTISFLIIFISIFSVWHIYSEII